MGCMRWQARNHCRSLGSASGNVLEMKQKRGETEYPDVLCARTSSSQPENLVKTMATAFSKPPSLMRLFSLSQCSAGCLRVKESPGEQLSV